MRANPVGELTDEENEPFLGTLTHEAWVGLSVEAVASDWYSFDTATNLMNLLKKSSPSASLVSRALLSSGSIEGAARRDLKEALIGAPQQASSLSVPIINAQPAQTPPPAPQKPSRGFGGR